MNEVGGKKGVRQDEKEGKDQTEGEREDIEDREDREEDKRTFLEGKRRPGSLKSVWRNSPLLHSTSGVNW